MKSKPLFCCAALIFSFSTTLFVYNEACRGGIIVKKLVFVIALAVFLCCCLTIFLVEAAASDTVAESEAVVKLLAEESMGEDTLELQRKLVRWYNLNLVSDRKDRDYSKAYWDILDLSDHAFGYISVPSLGIRQPIYHGTQDAVLEKGAGHVQQSAFPTGGEGNHSVMMVNFSLEEGDYFYIHILQEVRPFQVVSTQTVLPTEMSFEAVQGEELCTLVWDAGEGVKLIRGTYSESAPEEEAIRVETEETSDGWLIAACIVLALGILLVPFLMWCSRP